MSYWDTHQPPEREPFRDRIPPNFHEPTYNDPGDRSKMVIVLLAILVFVIVVGIFVYGAVFISRPDLSPTGFEQRQEQASADAQQACPQCDFGDQSDTPQGD